MKSFLIHPKFEIGTLVCFKNDLNQQDVFIVIAYVIDVSANVRYKVSLAGQELEVYDFEIAEVNIEELTEELD